MLNIKAFIKISFLIEIWHEQSKRPYYQMNLVKGIVVNNRFALVSEFHDN